MGWGGNLLPLRNEGNFWYKVPWLLRPCGLEMMTVLFGWALGGCLYFLVVSGSSCSFLYAHFGTAGVYGYRYQSQCDSLGSAVGTLLRWDTGAVLE